MEELEDNYKQRSDLLGVPFYVKHEHGYECVNPDLIGCVNLKHNPYSDITYKRYFCRFCRSRKKKSQLFKNLRSVRMHVTSNHKPDLPGSGFY